MTDTPDEPILSTVAKEIGLDAAAIYDKVPSTIGTGGLRTLIAAYRPARSRWVDKQGKKGKEE